MTTLRAMIAGSLAAGLAALTSGAVADGMPRYSVKDTAPAPFSWTGGYFGLSAGYAWGSSELASTSGCQNGIFGGCWYDPTVYGAPSTADFGTFNAATSGSLSPSGFSGGGQVGYNWQMGSAVLGVEADISSFGLSARRSGTGPVATWPGFNYAAAAEISADYLFTARARLGWAVAPMFLVYATGGFAMTELRVSNSFTDDDPVDNVSGASSKKALSTGWVVGGGAEWALNRNWTLRGEYLYVDLGSVSTFAVLASPSADPNTLRSSADITAHIARVGVNYKF